MFVYIGLLINICLFSFCCSFSKNKYLTMDFRLLVFIFLFLPAALRYGIGTDYFNYISIYNEVNRNVKTNQEYVWILINKFIIENNLGIQAIFVISSFLSYFFVFILDKKSLWLIVPTYFIFYYTFSYNCIRNAISIGFVICCLNLLINKRVRTSFIYLLIACTFHSSAFIYVPIYFLIFLFPTNKKMIFFFGIIIYFLFSYIDFLKIFFNSSLFLKSKYSVYYSVEHNLQVKQNIGIGILLRNIFLFLVYGLCKQDKEKNIEFRIISIMFLCLLVANQFVVKIYIFHRLLSCLYIGYLFILNYLIKQKDNFVINSIKIFCCLYFFIFEFIFPLLRNDNGILPYTAIF